MLPPPVTLTFDLLTLKVVSESRVTWATSVSQNSYNCLLRFQQKVSYR